MISLEAFHSSSQGSDSSMQALSQLAPLIWQKPSVGVTKANWDAAVDAKNQRIGVGAIVQNS